MGEYGIDFLDIGDISNVCIFMADALRWDHLPDSIDERGVTIKTIASAMATYASVPSMLTGMWPDHHGVLSWFDILPIGPSLLNQPGYECAYYQPGDEALSDGTFTVLQQSERRSLKDVSEPFIYFERHHGAHAPFNAIPDTKPLTFPEFIEKYAGDSSLHQQHYQKAVKESAKTFKERLSILEGKNFRDDTLVIFTSDHGEYLGEDGLVGHGAPIHPNGVYVPTVFIHPELPNIRYEGVIRHVDLYPTILKVLGEEIPPRVDGVDLTSTWPEHGYTISTMVHEFLGRPRRIYEARSIWDEKGGHVFVDSSLLANIMTVVGLIAMNGWQATHLRRAPRDYPIALKRYFKSLSYGSPGFSRASARDISNTISHSEPLASRGEELDEKTKNRLKELGYLE